MIITNKRADGWTVTLASACESELPFYLDGTEDPSGVLVLTTRDADGRLFDIVASEDARFMWRLFGLRLRAEEHPSI